MCAPEHLLWPPSLLVAAPPLLLALLRQVHLHEQSYLDHLCIRTLSDAHAHYEISGGHPALCHEGIAVTASHQFCFPLTHIQGPLSDLVLHSLPLALLLPAMLRDMRSCCRAQHADTGQADFCNAHPAIQHPLKLSHHRRLACHLRGGCCHRGTILGRGLLYGNYTRNWHGRICMCLHQQPSYFQALPATA